MLTGLSFAERRVGGTAAGLEGRIARSESLLGRVFRPGGTIAIRDAEGEAATIILGGSGGDLGSVLMSMGLSVKELAGQARSVVTSTGIGFKDEDDVLRLLITQLGVLFLDESGTPRTLISAEGVINLGDKTGGHQ